MIDCDGGFEVFVIVCMVDVLYCVVLEMSVVSAVAAFAALRSVDAVDVCDVFEGEGGKVLVVKLCDVFESVFGMMSLRVLVWVFYDFVCA